MIDDTPSPVPTLTLQGYAITHVGGRKHNEDAFVTGHHLFAVADGMGGHDAGEVAAGIVVESLHTIVAMPTVESADVAAALRRANDDIYMRGREGPATRRMGTTVTGIALTRDPDVKDRIVVFNVGDSRTYLLRAGILSRLTRDHSLVQELVDAGELTDEDARTHRRRNVVTRAIGIEAAVDIDFFDYDTYAGDRFLLCSDGLEVLTEAEVATILHGRPGHEAAQTLIDAAVAAETRDNVTVIVVDVANAIAGQAAPHSEPDTFEHPMPAVDAVPPPDIEMPSATERTTEIPFAVPIDGGPEVAKPKRRTRKSAT